MENKIPFKRFGAMIDMSRNAVMSVPALKKWIDISASLGYTALYLYTEDTYEVQNNPCFGYMRGRYSEAEMKEIDNYGFEHGIEVIPCIQTLAHMNCIVRWPDYCYHKDIDDIMLADDEFIYQLIDDMFATLTRNFRTRTVNIGMDEAHNIGRGQYLDKHGNCDRTEIFLKHLQKVADIAKKYGCEVAIWSDMFFRLATGGNYYVSNAGIDTSVSEKIPENVQLVYWDYYSTDKKRYDSMLKAHTALKKGSWFAGGLWSWMGPAPHNAYSMNATEKALRSCREHEVTDVMLTMWGDNGGECSRFALLPSLFYASEIAKGIRSMAQIKADFKEWCGISFDSFMLLDLPGTPEFDKNAVVNPDKYMLYNDPFAGLHDCTVVGGEGEKFASCARKLARMAKNEEYGHLFLTMQKLCEVLAVKYEIGVKTRNAYKAGDKAALKALIPDYKKLSKKLDEYYNAFRAQWFRENKAFGFEVQDLRLGGLMRRVKDCTERLADYVDGKTDKIEELEEDVLYMYGTSENDKHPLHFNWWGQTVTPGVIG